MFIILFLRVYVSNDPYDDTQWDTVLETTFPDVDGEKPNTDLHTFDLSQPVIWKRYLKFEILTHHGPGGGLQYLDIVRKPKLEKSGKIN